MPNTRTSYFFRYLAWGCSLTELQYNYKIGVSTKLIKMHAKKSGMKPEHSGSLYYNYKHFLSIASLALSDADYRFIAVDIGAFGKSSDSSMLKNSTLFAELNSKKLLIPDPVKLRAQTDPCCLMLLLLMNHLV
jgi:hypothetical protein